MNNNLQELYKNKFSYGEPCFLQLLREQRRNQDENNRPSYPLLLKIDEEKYFNSNIKIMVFGQETNTWEKQVESIEIPLDRSHEIILKTVNVFMDHYLTFFTNKLAKNGIDSPFWNTIKKIDRELSNSEFKPYIIWNNIYKIGNKSKDKNRPSPQIRNIENSLLGNLIEEEINILQPDVLVLFTGPNYEERIKKVLPIQQTQQFNQTINNNELAFINIKNGINGYRTYHPKSLYMQKKTNYIDIICKELKSGNYKL